MTGDLSARLDAALRRQEQHEDGTLPDAATLADLHARVARARRARSASYVAVAAVAAGVLGVGGWFGLHRAPAPQPAETPTPTVSPTPSPTATPSPSAAAEPTTTPPAPLVPVSLPGLPPMFEAPEGILDRTGPGWFVVAYDAPPTSAGEARTTLALNAPTGETYHLVDVTGAVAPLRWTQAGTLRAYDTAYPSSELTLDLRTGASTSDERIPRSAGFVGVAGDDEVWTSEDGRRSTIHVVPPAGPVHDLPYDGGWPLLSPDGRTVLGQGGFSSSLQVVDLATGTATRLALPEGQMCAAAGWLDTVQLLATCADLVPSGQPGGPEMQPLDQHDGQLVRLDATGGAPQVIRPLTAADVVPWMGRRLTDGRLVTTNASLLSSSGDCFNACFGGAFLWSEDGTSVAPLPSTIDPVDAVCEITAGGDRVLLRTSDTCFEGAGRYQWWSVDPTTGDSRRIAKAADDSESVAGVFGVVERATP